MRIALDFFLYPQAAGQPDAGDRGHPAAQPKAADLRADNGPAGAVDPLSAKGHRRLQVRRAAGAADRNADRGGMCPPVEGHLTARSCDSCAGDDAAASTARRREKDDSLHWSAEKPKRGTGYSDVSAGGAAMRSIHAGRAGGLYFDRVSELYGASFVAVPVCAVYTAMRVDRYVHSSMELKRTNINKLSAIGLG